MIKVYADAVGSLNGRYFIGFSLKGLFLFCCMLGNEIEGIVFSHFFLGGGCGGSCWGYWLVYMFQDRRRESFSYLLSVWLGFISIPFPLILRSVVGLRTGEMNGSKNERGMESKPLHFHNLLVGRVYSFSRPNNANCFILLLNNATTQPFDVLSLSRHLFPFASTLLVFPLFFFTLFLQPPLRTTTS